MLTLANIIIQLRKTICIALLLGLVAATSPQYVTAQPRNFVIEVTTGAKDACFYEIQRPNGTRLPNQDILKVDPGSNVRFKATGVDASIEVSRNDPAVYPKQVKNRGFTNRRRGNSFDLRSNGPPVPVIVRKKSKNGNSRHKIEIRCEFGAEKEVESSTKPSGPSFGAFESVLAIPAVPLPAPVLTIPGPKGLEIKIPDLDKLPQGPWRATGGPEMEVEDP